MDPNFWDTLYESPDFLEFRKNPFFFLYGQSALICSVEH